jgi:23S rRNA (cytidine1920-2'-O)/16S rRNA (cytidine1409-2'-O)-methyltransferase
VPRRKRARFVALEILLARRRPDIDPSAIAGGRVLVDGRILTNPAARVRLDASLRITAERRLRGERKLSDALDALSVDIEGRVALDIGANVGGFTTALLDHGVRRVYAVEAGVGLMLGRLRNDARVVNLEGINLGQIDAAWVPEPVEVITMDMSYLAVSAALPQLEPLDIADNADLVALVKPTFELQRGTMAAADADLRDAVEHASAAAMGAGWQLVTTVESSHRGRGGAREAFMHARRQSLVTF